MIRAVSTPVVILAALLVAAAPAVAGLDLDPLVCIPEGGYDDPPRAPVPVEHPPSETGLDMPVYEGATPPDLDPARPVLVLVQGLHGRAADWWDDTEYYGHNDMYDTAHDRGYKTFFVDLWDARPIDDSAEDGIDNGRLLKEQLEWIAAYWDVDRFNLLVHSKGGVDSNIAALMGAPIDRIVTLSSPHWGSPLADLAQTDWLWWLAELLGFNDDGTKFLQTGCMEIVRDIADGMPGNDDLSIYTMAATGWGPFLSPLEFGGLYLWTVCPRVDVDGDGDFDGFEGENDGLVCVEHARHPLSRDREGLQDGGLRQVWEVTGGRDYQLDHDSIRMGSFFFDFFWWWDPDCDAPIFDAAEPYLAVHGAPAAPAGSGLASPGGPPGQSPPLAQILRGGPLADGRAVARFPVEAGVERLVVSALVSSRDVAVTLVGPAGGVHRAPAATPAGGAILRGAQATRVAVPRPAAGEWSVRFEADGRAAYALVATLAGGAEVHLDHLPSGTASVDEPHSLRLSGRVASAETRVRIRRTPVGAPAGPYREESFSGLGRHGLEALPPGVNTLELTVIGTTREGHAYERNAVLSLPVIDPAAPRRLPEACQ